MTKTEDEKYMSAVRQKKPRREKRTASRLFSVLCLLSLLSACATPVLPPPAPRYVPARTEFEAVPRHATANSLWNDTASLYEDHKARRLNDLVTINVLENMTGSGAADTTTGSQSTIDGGITSFFGMPLNASVNKGRYSLTPSVGGSMTDAFKGNGATTRSGNLVGTITAKVVAVMPNGNLALESRKEITINNEKQILILRGMARPGDIAVDNTILSNRIADAEVYFVGDGILQEKQRPGWLGRVLGMIWPF